eukprot:7982010-Pyramimonas_sp.AAC.1
MEGVSPNDPTSAVRPLIQGNDLVMRGNADGPFQLSNYVERDGRFNLEALVCRATVWRWQVVFAAQWDGSMRRSCAEAVCRALAPRSVPRDPAPYLLRDPAVRCMGTWAGTH